MQKNACFVGGLLDTLSTCDGDFLPQTAFSAFSNVRVSKEFFQPQSQPALCQTMALLVSCLPKARPGALLSRGIRAGELGAGKSPEKEHHAFQHQGFPQETLHLQGGEAEGEGGRQGRRTDAERQGSRNVTYSRLATVVRVHFH